MIVPLVVLRCDAAFAEAREQRLVRCSRMLACDKGVARTRRWALRHGWLVLGTTPRADSVQLHLCPSHARRHPDVTLWPPAAALADGLDRAQAQGGTT